MNNPFIAIVGSVNMDLVFRTPRMPAVGETIEGHAFHTIAGGKGANQAVAIARQGIGATLIGCTGNDDFAKQLHQSLANDQINLDYLFCQADTPTGVAGILVNDAGHNSIVVAAGANHALTASHIESAKEIISRAALLVCQLETPLASVQAAIHLAKQNNIAVVFNPAPMQALSDDLLSQVDYLIVNQTEAEQLSGIEVADLKSMQAAAAILLSRGVHALIITLGEQGIFISQNSTAHAPENAFIPAIKVDAIDTTAAGDTFVGVFAAGLARGLAFREAAIEAQYAAALTVTQLGAQTSIPSYQAVDTFKQTSFIKSEKSLVADKEGNAQLAESR